MVVVQLLPHGGTDDWVPPRVCVQNIDGLEEAAGVPKGKITYCHGHLRTARCLKCKRKASALELAPTVAKGQVP